jgi:hypothetical protein
MLHCKNIQMQISKQMHQSAGNSLYMLCQWNPSTGLEHAHDLVDAVLANATYAMHQC